MNKRRYACTVIMALLVNSVHNMQAVEESNSQTWKKLKVLATAYCPCSKCCGRFADGKTAIGNDAFTKGVAVDKKLIPLRSVLKIPGYGEVVADDVGGAIKQLHIDVRFNTHKAALEWGRKFLTVEYQAPNS